MKTALLRAAIVGLALAISACANDGVAGDKTAQDKDSKDAKATAESAIPVEVAKPVRGEMLAMYSGTATLDAEADAEIVAKVGGEVRRILVEEGDHVKAGQLLAVLDDRQLRLEAAQTRAALAKSERISIDRSNSTRRAWCPQARSKGSNTISTISARPTTSRRSVSRTARFAHPSPASFPHAT
jgi:multidrug efflux pump subunit AcrA (membrane-fusion protein)